ncbi:hypothetical protein HOLleu_21876 [Holothuria leucospilota]|uniref:Ig-like domain-containing protein n=1 Tax=Holothuria leucospilota TaxID=206669 RepID=A0A9Q1H746_HOLLE|nr:hypothetical protein HOLleu_21876 [Holothuria leucospilota]
MARTTLAYLELHHAVLLCVLFIVRSLTKACPAVLANKTCKETFIVQTNGTVVFDCVTDHKSESKWWKNNDNECTTIETPEEKAPNHMLVLHSNFTLQLYNLTYEDIATYSCILFEDVIASFCLFLRGLGYLLSRYLFSYMPDWSIESYSKIADGDSSITIFERNELGITWTTGPANPAVILSWILNDMQHPSKTVENTNDDNTANYSTSALGSSDYRVNVPRVYRLSSNPQLVKKSVAVNVNGVEANFRNTFLSLNFRRTSFSKRFVHFCQMLRSVAVHSETREYCDPVGYVNGGNFVYQESFTEYRGQLSASAVVLLRKFLSEDIDNKKSTKERLAEKAPFIVDGSLVHIFGAVLPKLTSGLMECFYGDYFLLSDENESSVSQKIGSPNDAYFTLEKTYSEM